MSIQDGACAEQASATDVTGSDRKLLDVENLHVLYGNGSIPVVRNVSFSVEEGETLALVGESGSGKSTTGMAIIGLHKFKGLAQTRGKINLHGLNGKVRDLNKLRNHELRRVRGSEIAMIFQDALSSLNPIYKIGTQIIEAINLHDKITHAAAVGRAREHLARLGIADPISVLNCYPHELSGGMRQRVMIAIALACKPRLLIADEPTTALDVTIQAQIIDLLREIQADTGMSMLFITHNLGVVAEIAQRVMIMYGGQVVETGPVAEVFKNPRMPYTSLLLGSLPRIGKPKSVNRKLTAIPGSVPSPMDPPKGCYFHPRCYAYVAGLCDATSPELEACGDNHFVACHRWRGLTNE